jgi:membrane-bound lytic murein transglycosylase A
MVHHTITTKSSKANKASSKISAMNKFPFLCVRRTVSSGLIAAIVGSLVACSVAPVRYEPAPARPSTDTRSSSDLDQGPLPAVITQAKSRWVPVPWSELPGLESDALHEAWPAWLQSCTRPTQPWAALCPEVRQLANASSQDQRRWVREKLQPYRVESHEGQAQGKLTSYYEPRFDASRLPRAGFNIPLYAPPTGLSKNTPWFSRQDIETQPQARNALRGKALVYLADPIDAMVLHIQGSGLINVTEPDGSQRTVRMAFAASNEHPYKSIGSWLLQQGLLKDASWPGIKDWMDRNPSRVNELLWKNPRFIFFKEEALATGTARQGPKGAQNVPLTAGRSIAVDRNSIPYGTPVWLMSKGPQVTLDQLVMAQDTGSAIVGAVRADYYAGSGKAAGDFAGRINQPLQLWALWPR